MSSEDFKKLSIDDQKSWHDGIGPGSDEYKACADSMYLTLSLLSTMVDIVSITTIGAFASRLLYGTTPKLEAMNGKNKQPSAKQRSELGRTHENHGFGLPPEICQNCSHQSCLIHPMQLYLEVCADIRHPNKSDIQKVMSSLLLQHIMASIQRQYSMTEVTMPADQVLEQMYAQMLVHLGKSSCLSFITHLDMNNLICLGSGLNCGL